MDTNMAGDSFERLLLSDELDGMDEFDARVFKAIHSALHPEAAAPNSDIAQPILNVATAPSHPDNVTELSDSTIDPALLANPGPAPSGNLENPDPAEWSSSHFESAYFDPLELSGDFNVDFGNFNETINFDATGWPNSNIDPVLLALSEPVPSGNLDNQAPAECSFSNLDPASTDSSGVSGNSNIPAANSNLTVSSEPAINPATFDQGGQIVDFTMPPSDPQNAPVKNAPTTPVRPKKNPTHLTPPSSQSPVRRTNQRQHAPSTPARPTRNSKEITPPSSGSSDDGTNQRQHAPAFMPSPTPMSNVPVAFPAVPLPVPPGPVMSPGHPAPTNHGHTPAPHVIASPSPGVGTVSPFPVPVPYHAHSPHSPVILSPAAYQVPPGTYMAYNPPSYSPPSYGHPAHMTNGLAPGLYYFVPPGQAVGNMGPPQVPVPVHAPAPAPALTAPVNIPAGPMAAPPAPAMPHGHPAPTTNGTNGHAHASNLPAAAPAPAVSTRNAPAAQAHAHVVSGRVAKPTCQKRPSPGRPPKNPKKQRDNDPGESSSSSLWINETPGVEYQQAPESTLRTYRNGERGPGKLLRLPLHVNQHLNVH